MEYPKANILFKEFFGLRTSVADPKGNTLKDCKNLVRHRVTGLLEQADGYAKKYDFPALELDTIQKISDVNWENIHNFHVSEHDGADVTVLTGTYTKEGYYPGNPKRSNMCIFIRPYWDGTNWIDGWKELTEGWVFEHKKPTSQDVIKNDGYSDTSLYANDDSVGNAEWGIPTAEEIFLGHYIDMFPIVQLPTKGDTSYYLKATNIQWDAPLPANATLLGVEVKITRYANNDRVRDNSIMLASLDGDEKSIAAFWSEAEEEVIFGGSEDLWGALTLDTDSEDFGLAISCELFDTRPTPSATVKSVQFKRYYNFTNNEPNVIYVDDGVAYNFQVVDPLLRIFNSEYFKDWIIYFKDDLGNDKFFPVESFGYDTSRQFYPLVDAFYFKPYDLQTLPADGRKIYLYRFYHSNYASEGNLPATINSHFWNLFSECRLTTGGESTDMRLSIGLRQRISCGKTLDEITVESSKRWMDDIELWGTPSVVPSGGSEGYVRPIVFASNDELAGTPWTVGGGGAEVGLAQDEQSEFYVCSDVRWGQALPVGATLYGIEVEITKSALFTGMRDEYIMLGTISGGVLDVPGDNRKKTYNWSVNGSVDIYGGDNDLWGVTPSTDLATFCVAIRCENKNTLTNNGTIGDVRVKRYYRYHESGQIYFDTGTFKLGVTVVDDLGQESSLLKEEDLETIVDDSSIIFNVRLNLAKLQGSAAKFRFYIADSIDLIYYYMTEILLTADANHYLEGLYTFSTPAMTSFSDSAAAITSLLNRAQTDDGDVKLKYATVIGVKTFACGAYDPTADKHYPNRLFVSNSNGYGIQEYDVFPNDTSHILDLEYSDGDELLAVESIDQKIVLPKERSVVQVAQSSLGYSRDIVTRGYGLASFRSLVAFDDALLWADYDSILAYSTRGVEKINKSWLKDYRAMTDAVKQNSIAIIDRVNKQYRIKLGTTEYVMDLDSGEWMKQNFTDIPLRYAIQTSGRGGIDFLALGGIFSIGESRHNGTQFEIMWETSEIAPYSLLGEKALGYDFNVLKLFLVMDTEFPIKVELYKNGGTVVEKYKDISSDIKRKILNFDTGVKCNSFRIRVSGTTTPEGYQYQNITVGLETELIPIAGDITEIK